MPRVVLAYSGGTESSAAIPWLTARGATVVAVLVDLGQPDDLEAARGRAAALGAAQALVLDRRDIFLHDYAFKALAAGALGASRSPMSRALSRPVIAQAIVEVAGDVRAEGVAYALAEEGGPDLFGVLLRDLAPHLQVVAVDGHEHGAHEAASLWGRSLWWDAASGASTAGVVVRTPARRTPSDPATVAITFERGTPTAINGIAMAPLDLLASLATLALAQGVGRVESGPGAGGNQEIEEAPAALVLAAAYDAVSEAACARRRDATTVSAEYAAIIREGCWFSSSRAALDTQVNAGGLWATGTATLQLHKGAIAQYLS